jgi:endonuclease YncB( thermonuclease family)
MAAGTMSRNAALSAISGCLAVVVVGCGGLGGVLPRHDHAETRRAHIARVIDGDTVEVRLGPGVSRVVRLLAIDSPEKFATRYGQADECGSLAASTFMERYSGAHVVLRADPSQDALDRYGRLLRYVDLVDGPDLGAREVRRGQAMPYLYGIPARRYGHYLRLARGARRRKVGTWGIPCRGDFHSSLAGVQNGLP